MENVEFSEHTIQHTSDVIELYTWNLYNFINQCHPNKFNKNWEKEVSDMRKRIKHLATFIRTSSENHRYL